jgi:hypothetical protein
MVTITFMTPSVFFFIEGSQPVNGAVVMGEVNQLFIM